MTEAISPSGNEPPAAGSPLRSWRHGEPQSRRPEGRCTPWAVHTGSRPFNPRTSKAQPVPARTEGPRV